MPVFTFTTIDVSRSGTTGTSVFGINGSGDIAGTFRNATGNHGFIRFSGGITGFRWSAGHLERLCARDQRPRSNRWGLPRRQRHPRIPERQRPHHDRCCGSASTSPSDINNAGTIVGGFQRRPRFPRLRPFQQRPHGHHRWSHGHHEHRRARYQRPRRDGWELPRCQRWRVSAATQTTAQLFWRWAPTCHSSRC